MKALDLYSGCGGLSLGLQNSGFQVTAAVDSWAKAVASYRKNFDHPCIQADLELLSPAELLAACKVDQGEVDLLAGGPPCQGFSVQRIGNDEDSRNHHVSRFIDIALLAKPRCVLMENVPGIRGKRGANIIASAITRLHEGDYRVVDGVLNAADYGIPQTRKRFFLLALHKSLSIEPLLPSPTHAGRHVSVMSVIGDLPAPKEKVDSEDSLHYRTRLSALNAKRIALIPPGGGFECLPPELRVNCHRNGANAIGHRYVYGRMAPESPAPTITARFDSFTRGRFGHPVDPRNITLREGARIQTFPDHFQFLGTQEEVAAQIGNAVPPSFAEVIGEHIQGYLGGRKVVGQALLL